MRGLSHSDRQLISAMKDLERDWEQTASEWRDQARAEFQKEFMDDLVPSVRGAVNGITELNRILMQAIKECS